MRSAAWALLVAAPLLQGGGCETCPPTVDPPAMTELRAKELLPGLETGVALSTTHVRGDCRPKETPPDACGKDPLCARERTALRVIVLPVNVSLPVSPDCPGGHPRASLAGLAVFDGPASADGELAVALPAGRYSLLVSRDERCASCGVTDGGVCLLDVRAGEVTVRDVVLDEATH